MVRFFPSLKNGWGFTAPQNKRKMENQKKETSIEYFWDKVWKNTELYENEYIALRNALNEAKKMYAEEIDKAFEKGYIQGVNYTDGLINEERFPF